MTKTIAVLDADIISFRCAAANEKRSIKATHKVTGQEIVCPHRTALKEQIKDLFTIDEFDIEDIREAEDISHALHAMNTSIEALKKSCEADEVEIYLSGKDNFRDFLELPNKYKGSREGSVKPVQLAECRDYLVKKKGAIIVNGREVDDILAQRNHESLKSKGKFKAIACTLDGDQQGVMGWMYNWNKMFKPKLVQGLGSIKLVKDGKDFDGYGRKFFYAQWILGDSIDDFKPCRISGKKFGVVAMYNLLKDCKTDKECVQAIFEQYRKWYPDEYTEYVDWQGNKQKKTVIELMDMYAACAHMQRFDGDLLSTKTILDRLGIHES